MQRDCTQTRECTVAQTEALIWKRREELHTETSGRFRIRGKWRRRKMKGKG